jgi:hypothetical protein
VDDVHQHESYDLRCRREHQEIHVEVKGTTSAGRRVLLTSGQIQHARSTDHAALFVLHDLIVLAADTGYVAITDADPIIIDPWIPAGEHLEALTYRYTIAAGL